MQSRSRFSTEFVILPEIIALMVYILLLRISSIWLMLVLDLTGPEPIRLIDQGTYLGLSAINVGFAMLVALALLRIPKSSPSLRRGHLASLVLGAYALVQIQSVLHSAYGPVVFL